MILKNHLNNYKKSHILIKINLLKTAKLKKKFFHLKNRIKMSKRKYRYYIFSTL